MARVNRDQELLPSVWDRLIEVDSSSKRSGQNLPQLRRTIQRDLEDLLNTRLSLHAPPRALGHLSNSLANYGIPDPLGYDLSSDERLEMFRTQIESAIKRFESRFLAVRVTSVRDEHMPDRVLRFRIDVSMAVTPVPEPLVFSLDVEPRTRKMNVKINE